MAGKTQIDLDLRDEILSFLQACTLPGYVYDLDVPRDLYFRLKPQRDRKRKATPIPYPTTSEDTELPF